MMNYPKSPRPRIKRCKSESNVRGLTIGNIHALQNVSKLGFKFAYFMSSWLSEEIGEEFKEPFIYCNYFG